MTDVNASGTPLGAPLYGASLPQAVSRFFRKYARFDGRASRSEYWWFVLVNVLVYLLLGALAILLGVVTGEPGPTGGVYMGPGGAIGGVLVLIWLIVTFVPGLALTVRRLHDGNFSGWLILLNLIPSIGGMILLVLTILPANPEGARYDAAAG